VFARSIQADEFPKRRHGRSDLRQHRLGRRMKKHHMAIARLEDMNDVRDCRTHVEVGPGKACAHAAQHSDESQTDIRAHHGEFVSHTNPAAWRRRAIRFVSSRASR
jgi:hypothetical protein